MNYCKDNQKEKAGHIREDLNFFTEEQVLEHNKASETIWVSFRNGVYDITDFVASHPGY